MSGRKFRIEIDPGLLVPSAGVRKYYWWSVGGVVAGGVGLAVGWRYLPMMVPLLFTEPWGEARLVPKAYLVGLPVIGLVTTLVNVLLGKSIPRENLALHYALSMGALTVSLMLLTALYGIGQSLL